MSKVMRRIVSLMTMMVLGSLHARAEMISGSYTQLFGGDSSVWDLSGTYAQTLHGLRLEYTIAVEPDGKFRMQGMVRLHGDMEDDPMTGFFGYDFDGSFSAAGKLKSSGGVMRVQATIKAAGSGSSGFFGANFRAVIRQTLELCPELQQLVGNLNGKFDIVEPYLVYHGHTHRTLLIPASPVEIELPEGVDGSWELDLMSSNSGNSLAGVGRVELSNGRSHALDLNGKYQNRSDVSK